MSDALNVRPPEPYPEPEETGWVSVEGGRIWYRLNGRKHLDRGKTPLLCLHGGPGCSHDYLVPLTLLAERRPVILYDQLDCGRSDRPGNRAHWTVDHFVAEIDGVRAQLGLKDVAVFGSSCGGTWVGSYAVRRPAGLRAAILASPFLSASIYMRDAARLRAALPPAIRDALTLHEDAGTTASAEYQQAVTYWHEQFICRTLPWPPCVQRMVELWNADLYGYMWGPSEAKCTGTLKSFDLRDELSQIAVPSWYVCGEFDEITPESVTEFARLTPGSRLDIIAGASHMPHIERQAEFMALAHAFLDRHLD
jgi:proline iminopeptidase